MQKDLKEYLKLYLILESSMLRLPLGDFIMQAIHGGVTAIQLRDKNFTANQRFETAKEISNLIKGTDTLFIINNSIDIAVSVNAHGAHLGAEDLPPKAAAKYFPHLVLGYSCNTLQDVKTAENAKVHYAGVGPAFFTATKTNLRPVITPAGVKKIAESLSIPSIAIGGVDAGNIDAFEGAGVCGIAVSKALCASDTPYDAAKNLRQSIDRFRTA